MTRKIVTMLIVLTVGFFIACKSSNDAKITSDIKTRIADDQRLDAAKIDVDTKNGVVTLNGKVLGKQEENRAMNIAQTTPGVTKVVSRLEVETQIGNSEINERVDHDQKEAEKKLDERQRHESLGDAVDDASITAKVELAFAKDPDVRTYRINVDTNNGIVTLTGKVKDSAEAKRAITVAESVKGVKNVKSVLTVGS